MIAFGESPEMTEEEKLIRMCEIVQGKAQGSYSYQVERDEWSSDAVGINLCKVSDCGTRMVTSCHYSKANLLFDFITRKWEHNDELGRDLQHNGNIR